MSKVAPWVALPWLLLLLIWGSAAQAIESMRLELGRLSGPDWSLESVGLELNLHGEGGGGFSLNAENPRHPALPFPLKRISIDCPEGQFTDALIHCPAGTLSTEPALIQDRMLRFSNRSEPERGRWSFRLPGLRLAEGSADLAFEQNGSSWKLAMNSKNVKAGPLRELLKRWHVSLPPALEAYSAQLHMELQLSGAGQGVQTAIGRVAATDLAFETPDGLQAGEGLDLTIGWRARATGADRWRAMLELDANSGQLYVDPVFVDFSQQPLRTALTLPDFDPANLGASTQPVQVDDVSVDWKQLLVLSAQRLSVNPDGFDLSGKINMENIALADSYENLLKPFIGSASGLDLSVQGELSGDITLQESSPSVVQLKLKKVHVGDNQGRFAIYDLAGDVNWDQGQATRSELRFSGGNLFAFDLGAVTMALESKDGRLALLQPLELPIFDGGLRIDRLEYGFADPARDWLFEGFLKPISMEKISNSLGWPRMEGSLMGMIPAVRGRDGLIDVDGTLLIRAFDGDLTVRNLKIEDPFGLVPRLNADVRLDSLDLEKLTSTFSFGRITGQLEGQVNGLEMVNWQPQSFDARLRTPPGDDSPHRISQRAVDNLSSLGGGVSGMFSRGFLSFLGDFGYDRLGMSCRLENGVCHMDGIAPKESGYLIVEGSGLPRIDVVGFARQVDWSTLVERLKNVSLDNAPVVQ
ncbi:MAG: hypothetical protein ACPG4N_06705 [Gammaproteobacteria bacterium]